MWRSRCAVTNRRFGGHVILTLTRWDASLPPRPDNLVLMMQNEAQKLCDNGHAAFSEEVQQRIEERLRWARVACENSWETFDHTGGKQPCTYVNKPVRGSAGKDKYVGAAAATQQHSELPFIVICSAVLAFMLGYGTSRIIKS